MKTILTPFFSLLTFMVLSQDNIHTLNFDTLHVSDIQYTQHISLIGTFPEDAELEILHFSIIEGDTIQTFEGTVLIGDIEIDNFISFTLDGDSINFTIGRFETSPYYLKIIYRQPEGDDEVYILN